MTAPLLYKPNDDWINCLDPAFQPSFCELIRSLSIASIQKYPPAKIDGLPLGNEPRIIWRYLNGRSSMLDASGLSKMYRSTALPRQRLLYSAFLESKALTFSDWRGLIGEKQIPIWLVRKLLEPAPEVKLRSRINLISIDSVIYVVDPLLPNVQVVDSGKHLYEPPSQSAPEIGFSAFHRAYIGQDSLNMIEFLARQRLPTGRYMDVGTGAGAILLQLSPRFDESVGIDINERAVNVAQLNARLNNDMKCQILRDDAFNLGMRHGRFDLITWNLPFVFFPAEYDHELDGFGGDMGIELCLRFIEALPGLLTKQGEAYIAASAPILMTGENYLVKKLSQLAPRLGLDITVHTVQSHYSYSASLWEFHKRHGIRRFEIEFLQICPGSGRISRRAASLGRQLLDIVRGAFYERRYKL